MSFFINFRFSYISDILGYLTSVKTIKDFYCGGDEEERESGSEEAAAEIEIWDNSDSDIDKVLERQLLDSICKRYKKTGRTDGFHGAKIYI
ncbi:unnamed protein product [Rhizophagus irregularis]|uniref:Uncharacterized protein n=1 Tax=Rhizophagus irregularis TaxID=588596 RepID=A0A915ZN22_9GLOM|nr:unnamed protein product [Rhizophagus irregularis]CAB5182545.1 unnamed protein product [Rhizophagus irregularis]CAB5384013.1 unnamed protein product [Rhizophagus irregularis]